MMRVSDSRPTVSQPGGSSAHDSYSTIVRLFTQIFHSFILIFLVCQINVLQFLNLLCIIYTLLFIFTAMSTAVLRLSDLPSEVPHLAPRNARATIRHSHARALSALEPLNFPSITSLPPVQGWSSTTLDVPTVKKALAPYVTIKKDTEYP